MAGNGGEWPRVELLDPGDRDLGASLVVFWTTVLTREIYVANRWFPYDREPKHAVAAIILSLASILLFVASRGFLRRKVTIRGVAFLVQSTLVAALLFFNLVVVDVIIFKLYVNDKVR